MNKIHRTVWSEARQAYVVAAETAKSHGKGGSIKPVAVAVLSALGLLSASPAMAICSIDLSSSDYVNGASITGPCFVAPGGANGISNTGTVSGGARGIVSSGQDIGGGIVNDGTISGDSIGISVLSAATVSGGIVNNGLISGAIAGLRLENASTLLSDGVTNTGSIAGGIVVANGANLSGGITNSGAGASITGATAGLNLNVATVSGSIINEGTIRGNVNYGIAAMAASTITGGITNSGSGSLISGQTKGIYLLNSSAGGSLVNAGTIVGTSATNGAGIVLQSASLQDINNAGTIQAMGSSAQHYGALNLDNSTIASLTNSGLISANSAAVLLDQGTVTGDILNDAGGNVVSAGNTAIEISSSSSIGTLINKGTISGLYGGIHIGNTSSVVGGITNSGTLSLIEGGDTGISLERTSRIRGSIINEGKISGGASVGISLYRSASIDGGITNSGTLSQIIGGYQGISLDRNSSLGGSIYNQGTIEGGSNAGIAISSSSSLVGGITNSGTLSLIKGNFTGITISSSNIGGSIHNEGTISGYKGISLSSSNLNDGITNSGTGSLIEGLTTAINVNGSSIGGAIVNQGSLIAGGRSDAKAMYIGVSSTISGGINNSGLISAIANGSSLLAYGIHIDRSSVSGGIQNSGTITASANASGASGTAYGIYLQYSNVSGGLTNSGTITATADGSSSSHAAGIRLENSVLTGVVTNSGTISAANGISLDSASTIVGTITNSGLIEGTSWAGISINSGNVIDGSVINSGTIKGWVGIHAYGGTITGNISNSGLISGPRGGIELDGGGQIIGSVVNDGTIVANGGGSGHAIFLHNNSSVAGISNSGLIQANGSSFAAGIDIDSGSLVTNGIRNASTGRIRANGSMANYGISINNSSTLTGGIVNAGTISAVATGGGVGIAVWNHGVLQDGITNSGLISGDVGIVLGINGGTMTGAIDNLSGGRIVGSGGYAMMLLPSASLTVNNHAGATLSGGVMSLGAAAVNLNNAGLWVLPEDPSTPNTYVASNITGNFVQGSTGVLQVGVGGTASGQYSTLTVSGSASIAGTINVDVASAFNSAANAGGTLSGVVTATGGLTTSNLSVTDNSVLLAFGALTTANDLSLCITTQGNSCGSGGSGGGSGGSTAIVSSLNNVGNAPAIGAGTVLDQQLALYVANGTTGNAGMDNVLNLLVTSNSGTDQQVSNAVSQTLPLLVGSNQAAARTALMSVGRIIEARQDNNRGMSSGDEFYGNRNIWLKPFGSWTDQGTLQRVSGYTANTAGVIAGVDTVVSDVLRLGGAFAYARADVDGKSSVAPNSEKVDVYLLSAYGSYALDEQTEINFQGGIGKNHNAGNRQLTSFSRTAQSSFDSLTALAGVGVARTLKLSEQTNFIPSIRADYTWIRDESYTETGAGVLNLHVKERSTDELIIGVDGKLVHQFDPGKMLVANLGVGYNVLNDQASVVSSYAGAPGAAFTTYGVDPDPWVARAGLGYVGKLGKTSELTIRYDADYREKFLNQAASVKVKWDF